MNLDGMHTYNGGHSRDEQNLILEYDENGKEGLQDEALRENIWSEPAAQNVIDRERTARGNWAGTEGEAKLVATSELADINGWFHDETFENVFCNANKTEMHVTGLKYEYTVRKICVGICFARRKVAWN